ncbi:MULTISPECIES: YfhO family protein [Nocardioides]|uniref:YfhO family protein n=1 Tax=Nocardioides vastitatis TaxID=2568655 RepID=A0ABW0ZHT7_9ACTN|nr:YfhO family protein [Nocardioides sp.]THJ09548.1 hypothetical protein E7Z54_03350 [Nocardioides sp.]
MSSDGGAGIRARLRHATARDGLWTIGMLLILIGFTGVVLGPALLGRGTLLDVGLLNGIWPFKASSGPGDAIRCRADTVDFYMPGIANIRDAAFSGNLLTWSPYEVGGAPLASLPNHAVLSPLSWPYFVLPLWLAPAFVKLSELVVVIVGMTLLLRRFGVRRSAGMLAGLVFFTSGFMIMWTNWPHTRVAAFIPLLFWALDRVVSNRRPVDTVLVAVMVAAMLLGGFPAVTLFSLTFGAVYVLVRGLRSLQQGRLRHALTGWLGAGAGVLLGVGLAAVQIVPFIKNISAIGYEDRPAGGSQFPGYLMTVIAPEALGACRGGEAFGPSNPIGATVFLGAGALVLVLFTLVTRRAGDGPRSPVLLAGLFVWATVLLWVGGPALSLLQSLPGYDHNTITRLSSVFGFLGAVLAGFGFDRLQRRAENRTPGPAPRRDWRWIVLGVLVLGATVALFVPAFREAYHWAQAGGHSRPFLTRTAVGLVLTGLAAIAVVAILVLPGRLRLAGPAAVALLVAGQSTVFAHALLPLSDREDFYPLTPAHRFLQDNVGHDRYAGQQAWGYPATSDYYHLRTPVGHEFTDADWKAILARIDPDVQSSRTYSRFSGSLDTSRIGDEPLLDQLSVRYWATRPGEPLGEGGPWPAEAPQGTVRIDDVGRATCAIAATPLRGMQFRLAERFVPARRGSTILHTRITTSDGVLEGERALLNPRRRGTTISVGVPGERVAGTGTATVEVWVTGARRPVVLRGAEDSAQCSPILPPATDDGLDLVFAGAGALIYERSTALPRIRWAGRSQVVRDPDQQLELLAAGIPDDTVLLADGTPQTTPSHATVDIVEDQAETIRLHIDADGPGHVVLADSIARAGWTATLDGRQVPIHDANRALAAVTVDQGEHTLVLHYDAPGLRTGSYLTAASLLVALVLCAWHILTRRRPQDDGADPTADGERAQEPEGGELGNEGVEDLSAG